MYLSEFQLEISSLMYWKVKERLPDWGGAFPQQGNLPQSMLFCHRGGEMKIFEETTFVWFSKFKFIVYHLVSPFAIKELCLWFSRSALMTRLDLCFSRGRVISVRLVYRELSLMPQLVSQSGVLPRIEEHCVTIEAFFLRGATLNT